MFSQGCSKIVHVIYSEIKTQKTHLLYKRITYIWQMIMARLEQNTEQSNGTNIS